MIWLRDKLSGDALLSGIWLASGSPVAAELAAQAKFDWALLDLEHGMLDEDQVLRLIEAFSHGVTAPLVRIPQGRFDLVQRVLDHGAAGIMLPQVESAEEAAAFVQILRYPPAGTRGLTSSSRAAGYGSDFAEYFRRANAAVAAIVQVETPAGVAQADAIAAVPGVDVLFIGHSDLSLRLGCFDHYDAPALVSAENAVIQACRRHGKRPGMLLKASMSAAACRNKGFSFLALGSDMGCLKQGFRRLLETADGPAR